MPIYDCGDPACVPCDLEFGPARSKTYWLKPDLLTDRQLLPWGEIMRYRRSRNCIYDAISSKPVWFFSTERDAQMCMTLMEAVTK